MVLSQREWEHTHTHNRLLCVLIAWGTAQAGACRGQRPTPGVTLGMKDSHVTDWPLLSETAFFFLPRSLFLVSGHLGAIELT